MNRIKSKNTDDALFDALLYGGGGIILFIFVVSVVQVAPESIAFFFTGLISCQILFAEENSLPKLDYIVSSIILIILCWVIFFAVKPLIVLDLSSFEILRLPLYEARRTLRELNYSFIATFCLLLGAAPVFFKIISVSKMVKFFSRKTYPFVSKKFGFKLSFFGEKDIKNRIKIGENLNKKPFYLTEDNLVHHTQIIGGSGYGKTNLLKLIIEDRIAKGQSVIMMDFKGEKNMRSWIESCSHSHGRHQDFSLLSISNPKESILYNPFEYGSEGSNSTKLKESFKWSEVFYEKFSQSCIEEAFSYLHKIKKIDPNFSVDFLSISNLINSKKFFEDLEEKYNIFRSDRAEINEFCSNFYTDMAAKNLMGLKADLRSISKSSLIKNISNLSGKNSKSLKEIIKSKGIFYVQMSAMLDKIASQIIGKILLQDLICTVGDELQNSSPNLETLLVIDEFSEFASENFVGLLNKCRGAGMGIVLAHQSVADLSAVSSNFSTQVFANTANKIIFGTSDSIEAESFSSMFGTKKSEKKTFVLEKGMSDFEKGKKGSSREVEEFVIHPNQIKDLNRGQAAVLKKIVDTNYGIINIDKASKFSEVFLEKKVEQEIKKNPQTIENPQGKSQKKNIFTFMDKNSPI